MTAAGRLDAWTRRPRSRLPILTLVASLAVAAVLGLIFTVGGSTKGSTALPVTPPRPAAPIATVVAPTIPTRPTPPACSAGQPPAAGRSDAPQHLCIPSIGVNASVIQLGLNADGTVQVPALSQVADAGWYRYSAAPGRVGPTVILGHVDSAQYGDGVFFRLGQMHAGDTATLVRADGKFATYRINSVVEVPKSRFPTQDVYGPTSGPALRLITCGGAFDSTARSYVDNIIAYGTLLSLRTI